MPGRKRNIVEADEVENKPSSAIYKIESVDLSLVNAGTQPGIRWETVQSHVISETAA